MSRFLSSLFLSGLSWIYLFMTTFLFVLTSTIYRLYFVIPADSFSTLSNMKASLHWLL